MSCRAEYYGELSQRNVMQAFEEISPLILKAQQELRAANKDHILLALVTIEEGNMKFARNFGDHLATWTRIPKERLGNWYSSLGYYVDLLESETRKSVMRI